MDVDRVSAARPSQPNRTACPLLNNTKFSKASSFASSTQSIPIHYTLGDEYVRFPGFVGSPGDPKC